MIRDDRIYIYSHLEECTSTRKDCMKQCSQIFITLTLLVCPFRIRRGRKFMDEGPLTSQRKKRLFSDLYLWCTFPTELDSLSLSLSLFSYNFFFVIFFLFLFSHVLFNTSARSRRKGEGGGCNSWSTSTVRGVLDKGREGIDLRFVLLER